MQDLDYLEHATQLAAAVDPHPTAPNPRVGCVVVFEDQVVATGVHHQRGQAHAEANALTVLKTQSPDIPLNQCTVYVTLEPCIAFPGKQTPACSQVLIEASVGRIVVGALDPHFAGQGLAALNQAGVKAELLAHPGHDLLNPFSKTWVTQNRPYICLKVAQSLDGRITNDKRYLTNQSSRQKVHQLRAECSAILTTTRTVLADNPELNVRLPLAVNHPTSDPDIIVMGETPLPNDLHLFSIPGRSVQHLQTHDLSKLITFCQEQQIDSLLTECGGTMNTALLQSGLVDELQLFIAPQILGDRQVPSFTGLYEASDLQLVESSALGDDLHLVFRRAMQ